MSETPISPPVSPLRRRMIEDMTVRQFVEKTQADYIRHVRTFTAFLISASEANRGQACRAASGIARKLMAMRL